jgi:hypothetical protein
MQRCPKCNRTYQDDAQKFCTHDGGRLAPYTEPAAGAGDAPTTFDLGVTLKTDASGLGETVLNAAAELNKTMAAPPPPPPPPKPAAAATPPPPLNRTVAAAPPPSAPSPSPSATPPPQNKTIAAPPPTAPQTSELRPTSTIPNYSPTAEIARPQGTTGFQTPPTATPQPSPWQPAPPTAQPAVGQQVVAPPPARKSSRMPLILGGVVVLLCLLIGVGALLYFALSKPKSADGPSPGLGSNISTNTKDDTNSNAGKTNVGSNGIEAPPNSARFVNSRANLDGKLAEHYLDFSFYYPRLWTLDPKAGVTGASNFVKIDRIAPPNFPLERFAVGWYDSNGTVSGDRAAFPNLVQKFDENLSKTFPEYQKVSEGETKINSYDGYEFRFKSVARGTEKGDITYWGRVVFLPSGDEAEKSGLVLLMFTTSIAADLNGVDDIGKKGELPMILDTFKLGSNP